MITCFTGSKYSDIEELRKKLTQYFNIMLLSSEMYFDVHYDYTTSLRHPWYMSGFVLFRNLKKISKKKKKENSVQESIQLCAHSLCTITPPSSLDGMLDQGSQGPTGGQVISLHIYSMYVQFRSITVKHYHGV